MRLPLETDVLPAGGASEPGSIEGSTLGGFIGSIRFSRGAEEIYKVGLPVGRGETSTDTGGLRVRADAATPHLRRGHGILLRGGRPRPIHHVVVALAAGEGGWTIL